MRLKITAPEKHYRGDVSTLMFRDGVAYGDSDADAAAVAYCRRRGYTVEDADPPAAEAEETDSVEGGMVRPRSSDPKADWVTYAANHPDENRRLSEEDADSMTKAELVELYSK